MHDWNALESIFATLYVEFKPYAIVEGICKFQFVGGLINDVTEMLLSSITVYITDESIKIFPTFPPFATEKNKSFWKFVARALIVSGNWVKGLAL